MYIKTSYIKMDTTKPNGAKETEILNEIRASEKKADEITEQAGKTREDILQKAERDSSELLAAKKEEIRKAQEKKLVDFKGKIEPLRNKKLEEGKNEVKQLKAKAQKNTSKAVEFVVKKLEEEI